MVNKRVWNSSLRERLSKLDLYRRSFEAPIRMGSHTGSMRRCRDRGDLQKDRGKMIKTEGQMRAMAGYERKETVGFPEIVGGHPTRESH